MIRIIRTCLKAGYFGAFHLFLFDRRQPIYTKDSAKTPRNLLALRSKILKRADLTSFVAVVQPPSRNTRQQYALRIVQTVKFKRRRTLWVLLRRKAPQRQSRLRFHFWSIKAQNAANALCIGEYFNDGWAEIRLFKTRSDYSFHLNLHIILIFNSLVKSKKDLQSNEKVCIISY